jgi:DNA-binding protein HU-beta
MATARMTQTQLVRHLATRCEMNNKVAQHFLDELAKSALQETKKNGLFVVPGLGRLVKSNRKARMGRNPATGQPIQISAKTVVKFRVAKVVKESIATGKQRS